MSRHDPRAKWRLQPAMGVRGFCLVIFGLVSALVLGAGGIGPATSASNDRTAVSSSTAFAPPGASDAAVIADWNATAVATLITDAARSPAEAYLYFAFTHAAMYNAVVGITGKYRPYRWHAHGPPWASPEAAAASAAYYLLLHYFPTSRPRLDAAFAASLAGTPDGASERAGVRFGKRAAHRIIFLRADDGRYAPLEFTKPVGPGVWRPTAESPVPFAPFSTTWLAELKPLVLNDADQFRPGPPPALTSARYAREYNEVKDFGGATGSLRTEKQTQTALFFSDIGVGGLQAALRDLVTRRGFNISASARLLAVANVAAADGFVSTWDAKFHYGFWRPTTAIQLGDTDGNDATDPDPTWKPLILNPPYPDYTSGLNTAVGAISRAVAKVLGTNRIDLFITSVAAAETRHYRFARRLNRSAINARIWSGLHFRTADVVGNHRAQDIARYVFHREFRP